MGSSHRGLQRVAAFGLIHRSKSETQGLLSRRGGAIRAQSFEATISASQTEWTREALRRTACVSYVASEACEVAARTSWSPQDCGTYHDLLDREERRLDKPFGSMMPDELTGPVVAASEVWLDDAYDNITLAQACITARREQEEERLAAPEGQQEPSDGETSAEKACGS